jgi:transmembrane sensor
MKRAHGYFADRDDCFDQAAAWYVRWQQAPRASLAPEELEQWTAWFGSSENKAAYDAVKRVADLRPSLQPPPRPSVSELAADDFDGAGPLLDWHSPATRIRTSRLNRTAWLWAGMAAAAAIIGMIAIPRIMRTDSAMSANTKTFSTSAGEKKQITLPDGSQVFLGDQTDVVAEYGRCQRRILLNRGEALFSVAHDKQCPFDVLAGDGVIRAVGTRFSVRRTLDRVTVVVAEGIVEVKPRVALVPVPRPDVPQVPAVRWSAARLVEGQEVTFDGSEGRTEVKTEDPRVATAWLDGRREYRNEPLAYVVADMNRYFRKKIVLTDAAVGEVLITGRVKEGRVMDWLHALETMFPIKVSEAESGEIVISRAGAGSKTEPPLHTR